MHKMVLTQPECEIINGSDEIIEAFGCFPSMENGELQDVRISLNDAFKYDVELVFCIDGWKEMARVLQKYCGTYKEAPYHHIKLLFQNADEVHLDGLLGAHRSAEIKFGNTLDRSEMYQDCHPSDPIVIPRPFRSFYIGWGVGLVIGFDETECGISAKAY